MAREKQNTRPLDVLWDLFASVKLTVLVLILLAATSIVGTLIPQNGDPAFYMRAYGEFAYRLLYVFDILDMYHSWWFQTLIIILTINITVCTIKRWPSIWKIVSSKTIRIGPIEKKHPLSEFEDPRDFEKLGSLYHAYLKRRYSNHQIESDEACFRIVAERGRWTRLGVPAVHLSIVVILAGALIGSFLGFDGFVNIPEGSSANSIRLRNGNATLPLGFEVRCNDFNVSFYDTGAPKEFRSSLVILEDGQKVVEKDIIVNDPLRYKGVNFFQSSYGSLPPKVFDISFSSKDSNQILRHSLSIGQSVELPDGKERFTIQEYTRNYRYKGAEVGDAVLGVLEKPGTQSVDIALPVGFPTFDKMRKGNWIISIDRFETSFYTGLQVTKDPGVALVYAGFLLLIVGCWVAFFMSHKKIIVNVQPSPNSSRIRVFCSANRNRLSFENTVRKLGEELSKL